nr:arsenite methyltransferase [Saprospiraceae bacterium]
MNTKDLETKDMVRKKYAEIAGQDQLTNASSCCGAGGCSTEVYNIMTDDYSHLEGYQSDADLGLGCGLPTEFALIKKGDTVVDLGSGAGNDCFVARHETGPEGKVIGIDFTPEMVAKARQNADKLGFNNVEFREGDIESMPLAGEVADVVVSNCVLNLIPNKKAAFSEVFRILKPGGHFSISDIVLTKKLPSKLISAAEMYAGCVSGAVLKNEYLTGIEQAGFESVQIQKEKPIVIPRDILSNYLDEREVEEFLKSEHFIYSITVFGKKPQSTACTPGGGCC